MLDYHGLAGVPAENQTVVASRHGITARTLTGWSMTLTAAGRRLPLSAALAAEAARRSRAGDDHLARTRIARTLGLTIPQPANTPSPPDPPSPADRAAAAIAIRVLATAGPLPMNALYAAVRRSRRFGTLPPVTADQLALALSDAGATTGQGIWQAPGDAIAPARDRALFAIVAGRELARQEMIAALVAAGYTTTSARSRKINSHPLIRHVGPDRYRILGEPPA
jgi:hypothetical protein